MHDPALPEMEALAMEGRPPIHLPEIAARIGLLAAPNRVSNHATFNDKPHSISSNFTRGDDIQPDDKASEPKLWGH